MDASRTETSSTNECMLKEPTKWTARHKFIGHAPHLRSPTEDWPISVEIQTVQSRGTDRAGQSELKWSEGWMEGGAGVSIA